MLEQKKRVEKEADALKTYSPDLIIALNPLELGTMLTEAKMAQIPTIGLIDTNMDPRDVSYVIPGNDDSVRTVALVAGILSKAALRGQTMRDSKLKKASKKLLRQD